ncbi:MAG: efflux RND transporter periplasmic adaptor subunit [Betaproteobacteria bacterium]
MKLFTPGKMIGLVAIAALAGGGYWMLQKNKAETAKPKYRTQAIDRGTIAQRISANGTLNPVTVVNVGTQISGTVVRLHTDFNARVKAGQILAELDPSLLKAQIAQSEATLRSAQATATLARTTLERNHSLRDRGFISDSALDSSRKDVDAALGQLAALRAQIDRDKTNLSYSVIRSPINGIVVDRTIDVGQTVAASFQTPTLFKIAKDLQAMQIDTSVSEADIGNIKPGMPVAFTVDAFRDKDFSGQVRVIRLNPTVQQNVVTYNVVIDVRNDTGVLLPGMTAQVNIVTQRRDSVLRLPNAALRFRPAVDAEPKPDKGADRNPAKGELKTEGKPEQAGRTATGPADPAAKDAPAAAAAGAIRTRTVTTAGGAEAEAPMGRFGPLRRATRIYKLNEAGDPVPVDVKVGIADTRFSELVGDALKEGDAVIVREIGSDKGVPAAGGPNFRMRLF